MFIARLSVKYLNQDVLRIALVAPEHVAITRRLRYIIDEHSLILY